MDAHKDVGREGLFKCFHAEERHDGFLSAVNVDFHIILEPLDVDYFVDVYLYELIFTLYDDIVPLSG